MTWIQAVGGGWVDDETLAVAHGSPELHDTIEEFALSGCGGCGMSDPAWVSKVLLALERRGFVNNRNDGETDEQV